MSVCINVSIVFAAGVGNYSAAVARVPDVADAGVLKQAPAALRRSYSQRTCPLLRRIPPCLCYHPGCTRTGPDDRLPRSAPTPDSETTSNQDVVSLVGWYSHIRSLYAVHAPRAIQGCGHPLHALVGVIILSSILRPVARVRCVFDVEQRHRNQ